MTEFLVHSQPAYILHQQNYLESSLLVDALTRDFGRISFIAKGVRKVKSKNIGVLRPFTSLSLSFVGKAELKTLVNVEQIGLPHELKGLSFYCGFYVNELICNFLHKNDPYPEVFQDYQLCLIRLIEEVQIEPALRAFEFNLMDHIGYGLQLDYDVRNDQQIDHQKKYSFSYQDGMVEDLHGQFSGASLFAMQRRQFDDPCVLAEAKLLIRIVIDHHLQGRKLKSRSVFNKVINWL